jgi:glyoxylase-like metal-dependent hydrolase (beta-lactamase superfamily II)
MLHLILAAAIAMTADTPQKLSDGVWLIPGSFPEGRQPDGNTIVFETATGLIVMDTGRHPAHRQAILDFARAEHRPVVAIVNSHWHLDHSSGNRDIKAAYPNAKLYTGTAVERMARDFFPKGVESSRTYLANNKVPPGLAEDIQLDIDTRLHPEALLPDVPVTQSAPVTIDGKVLDINLAPNAATDGDVWVYDEKSHIAAAGDLITLPVPFLDTACVGGWRVSLDAIAATPFVTVVPGHGAPMTRPQFLTYKAAFESYTDCAHGARDKAECAADWARATASLRAPEAAGNARTLDMAGEYVDLLRANGGNGQRCLTP